MIQANILGELHQIQELIIALVEDLDEKSFRSQYHPDLSPPGWHLGHCVYTECYWLQEVVRGDNRVTAALEALYTPARTPRPERGGLLPDLDHLLRWAQQQYTDNLEFLANLAPPYTEHALFRENYLPLFLIQHHSQHYETMLMVLTERELSGDHSGYEVRHTLQPAAPDHETRSIAAGHYRVGGEAPCALDNEMPPQQAELGPCDIAIRPTSNAEFLCFMEEGGYRQRDLWSEAGWQYRCDREIRQPQHWRQNTKGDWYGVALRGPCDLAPEEPVFGISWHEAQAYAKWVRGRLPHEHQWEVACRLHQLESTGRVWEWCGNAFYPYAGFRAFPYPEYSTTWFDENHFSLRGGSLHTRPPVRRPSFRNFYEPEKRHIFAGLRPAF